MKRRIMSLLLSSMLVLVIIGCGSDGISDDMISINKYKELSIEADGVKRDEVVWNALLKHCELMEYPEEELQSLIEELERQYGYASHYRDMTASELIEEKHGMSIEELAKERLKKKYAISLIAEQEHLEVSEAQYEKWISKKAKENGLGSAEEYESMFGEEELRQLFLEERVYEF